MPSVGPPLPNILSLRLPLLPPKYGASLTDLLGETSLELKVKDKGMPRAGRPCT